MLGVLIQRADLWMVVGYPKMLLPGSPLMDVQAGRLQIISHIPTINYYTFLVPVGNGQSLWDGRIAVSDPSGLHLTTSPEHCRI